MRTFESGGCEFVKLSVVGNYDIGVSPGAEKGEAMARRSKLGRVWITILTDLT